MTAETPRAERCAAVDEHGMGQCLLDADHTPNWLGVTHHAWEKVPGPPGPPQRWSARPAETPRGDDREVPVVRFPEPCSLYEAGFNACLDAVLAAGFTRAPQDDRVQALEAEVAHWKAHAEEAGEGFSRVCLDYARVAARNSELVRRLESASQDDRAAQVRALREAVSEWRKQASIGGIPDWWLRARADALAAFPVIRERGQG